MTIEIVFETHAITEDNEAGRATGWLPGRLSAEGRRNAAALGDRRRDEGLAAVFSSDLTRAMETVEIAFAGSPVPRLADWRLRECDYGSLNGASVDMVHAHRLAYLDDPYPGGESWGQATERVIRFLGDLPLRWDGARVLVVGHVATRWGLDRGLDGADLPVLVGGDFSWQPGWHFTLPTGREGLTPRA